MTLVRFEASGVRFEWDAAEAEANIAKHGIAFPDAAAALASEDVLVEVPADRDGERRRMRFVGLNPGIITVVYVLRDGALRLISVRVARRAERGTYETVRLAKLRSEQGIRDDR